MRTGTPPFFKGQELFDYPQKIRLDASTVCQLRCPVCPTSLGETGKNLGAGFLSFKNFKKFIESHPRITNIELSNWGEIFLNPELIKILEYAYLKHVKLSAENGANLNTVSENTIEAMVRYRLRDLCCSIDGTSQETYSHYRRNGNFHQVIANIKKINFYKKLYNSPFPRMTWQFVAFGHNEHEINRARKMASKLGINFFLKLNWERLYSDELFSPVNDTELIKNETGLGVANRDEYREKYGKEYIKDCCLNIWHEPQINYDGRLLGCLINYWGNFGNVFSSGLTNCLKSEKIQEARLALMGKKVARNDIPCSKCRFYEIMSHNKTWITKEDLEKLPDNRNGKFQIFMKKNIFSRIVKYQLNKIEDKIIQKRVQAFR
jgi:MoaA/NifB/PqqE/SkfB family radical SAM enzyme